MRPICISVAYLACPSCRFLVGPDDTTCRWCSIDLVAARAHDPVAARAQSPAAVAAAKSARGVDRKGRKSRPLPPPTPPAPVAGTTPKKLIPPASGLPPFPTAPAAKAERRAGLHAPPPVSSAIPAPATASAPPPVHRWRSRAAAFGIAAALAILGGTVGVLMLRPGDPSIASDKQPTTVTDASGDPLSAWTVFTAPDGSFSVKFPTTPTARDDKVPDGALPERMYASDPVAVYVSDLPLTLDENQLDTLFASSVDSGLALLRARATIQAQAPVRVLGLPAQEITLHADGRTSYATFILTRHRVLLLMTAASDLALHHAFVSSLELPSG